MTRRPAGIALLSAMILILELSFIRLVPAEVRAISYFTNLMLAAGFSGLGLGCILERQRSLALALPLGMLLVLGFVLLGRGIVIYAGAADAQYFLQYPDLQGRAPELPLFAAAAGVFVFAATPFVALGQALARAMDEHPRLVAYGWDIAGSIAGTLLFALESLLGFAPWLWPIAVAALFALCFERGVVRRAAFAAAGLPFLALAWSPQASAWSPYYYVQHQTETNGLRVFVNSSFHQFAIDFTDGDAAKRQVQEFMLARWGRPYVLYRDMHGGRGPEKVLVLGAGTGNDVHVAHVNGAREIVAVEIDPEILALGRTRNPTRPYDHPGVRTVLDDARHFLRSTDEKFDLVVFGTLDSQALLSSSTNLRLDNYVYTQEALADARRVVHDRGLVVLYYSVFKPWLYERIFSTVRAAFGDQAMLVHDDSPFLFDTIVVASKGSETFRGTPEVIAKYGGARPASDDWPFIYLEKPTIAPVYLQLMGFVALLMVGAFLLLRRVHPSSRGLHLDFFCLGLGFTLMESSAIARLALLFGSTWVVNAVVITSVLAVVFLANWTVQRERAPQLALAWAGLGASILVNFAFPLALLFELPTPARALACALLIGAPVYCASVCFSRLFARERATGYPLGMNLIGAMGGGLLEYVSMAIGMRGVWLVALGVYALAFGAHQRFARTH